MPGSLMHAGATVSWQGTVLPGANASSECGQPTDVGSDETRFVDVRVLAATNVDLQQRIADGTFRRDLYYRLNVIPIHVPPLREREDDIVLITHHVLQKLARRMGRAPKRMSAEAMRASRVNWSTGKPECRNFNATARSSSSSCAFHTSPMPPRPTKPVMV